MASREKDQVPGTGGGRAGRGWWVPIRQAPRGLTWNTMRSGTRPVGRAHHNQFSRKQNVPNSSEKQKHEQIQTREETEKVVKGLTARMGEDQTWSLRTWRNRSFPRSKPFQSAGQAGANTHTKKSEDCVGKRETGGACPSASSGPGTHSHLCPGCRRDRVHIRLSFCDAQEVTSTERWVR